MYNTFIGIDPGVNGGLAIICPSNDEFFVYDIPVVVVKMTTKTKGGNYKKKKLIDLHLLNSLVNDKLTNDHKAFAIMEKVNASPQMGVVSSFNFGYAFGACEAILASSDIPYELVLPAKWKFAVGLRKKADKEESRLHAIKLFPKLKDRLKAKKDHNRAEALLIAEYARRVQNGN